MLSPMQRAMIARLRHGPVPSRRLIDEIYGEREDGGPEDAGAALRVAIHKLRNKLALHGVEIETMSFGQKAEGYRVRPEHCDLLDRLLCAPSVTVESRSAA